MYATDSEGKFIPATQRPDGTWRKARRVKEGYVPQEEVPLYESKGKQFAQRKTGLPPGMCPQVAEAAKKEREKQERAKAKKEAVAAATKASTSGKKPKQMHQPTAGILVLPVKTVATTKTTKTTSSGATQNDSAVAATAISTTTSANTVDALSKNVLDNLKLEADDDTQELAKQLKKLRKKLREIEVIEEKLKSGDLKKPEKDQMEKVKRKKEILRDIKLLEASEQQQKHTNGIV